MTSSADFCVSLFVFYFFFIFYDIFIYRENWNDHLIHIHRVLEILQQNKLFLKREKCQIGLEEVQYLGHVISRIGC
jgi:hypothetical protein